MPYLSTLSYSLAHTAAAASIAAPHNWESSLCDRPERAMNGHSLKLSSESESEHSEIEDVFLDRAE